MRGITTLNLTNRRKCISNVILCPGCNNKRIPEPSFDCMPSSIIVKKSFVLIAKDIRELCLENVENNLRKG